MADGDGEEPPRGSKGEFKGAKSAEPPKGVEVAKKGEKKGEFKGEKKGEFKGEKKGEFKGEKKGEFKGEKRGEFKGEKKGEFKGEKKGELKGEKKGDKTGSPSSASKPSVSKDIDRDAHSPQLLDPDSLTANASKKTTGSDSIPAEEKKSSVVTPSTPSNKVTKNPPALQSSAVASSKDPAVASSKEASPSSEVPEVGSPGSEPQRKKTSSPPKRISNEKLLPVEIKSGISDVPESNVPASGQPASGFNPPSSYAPVRDSSHASKLTVPGPTIPGRRGVSTTVTSTGSGLGSGAGVSQMSNRSIDSRIGSTMSGSQKPTGEIYRSRCDYIRDLAVFDSVVPPQQAELKVPGPEADDGSTSDSNNYTTQTWGYYTLGGEDDLSLNLDPLVLFPPETAGPEVFYYLMDILSTKGYKCIAVSHPPFYTLDEFSQGFGLFLDHVQARRCHLFGAGLGGYLCQVYAAGTPRRVASMILCNSFCTYSAWSATLGAASIISMLPVKALQRLVLKSHLYETDPDVESDVPVDVSLTRKGMPTVMEKQRLAIREAEAWSKQRLLSEESITSASLASKCALLYAAATLPPKTIEDHKVMLMRTNDIVNSNEAADSNWEDQALSDLQARYERSKICFVKYGGTYPFLCNVAETTLMMEVHLRNSGYFPEYED